MQTIGDQEARTMKQYFYMSGRREFPTQEFHTQLNFIKIDGKAWSLGDSKNYLPQTFFQEATAECVLAKQRNEPRKGKVQSQRLIQIKGELKGIPRKW